jgi:hypothetical protein
MRSAIISALLLSGVAFASSTARADDVTIQREERPNGVVIPLPIPQPDNRDTVVERRSHDRDCDTKTVHRENDMGDSKTTTRTRCE